MVYILKRLTLGFVLILIASAILLFSDLQRRKPSAKKVFHVALFQYASRLSMDTNHQGLIDGLASEGLRDGDKIILHPYNAQNDMPTANNIAQEIVNNKYDLVITSGTICLQAMANANREGRVVHLFNMVTDPYGAGVRILSDRPGDHPRHLIGMGSFQPVEECLRLAKRCYPDLQTIGTITNPSEANSEACLIKARSIAHEQQLNLLEVSIENSSGVYEAAQSLVTRGVQAIWVGYDNTVDASFESVIKVAQQAHIPVLSNEPQNAILGALFGVGANYRDVGLLCGILAGRILKGADVASMSVKNIVPLELYLNQKTLSYLQGNWQFPTDVSDLADLIIDEEGSHEKGKGDRLNEYKKMLDQIIPSSAVASKQPRTWSVHVIKYLESPSCEQSESGIYMGLKESGLHEGMDYEIKAKSAQGDMASLSVLMDAAMTEKADMVITLSTPTLQAAIRKLNNIPIVFTHVADPFGPGAGKSCDDHLPNLAGAYNLSDYEGLIASVSECIPGTKSVGSLYSPSESNSVFHKENLDAAGKKLGIKVVFVGVSSSAEVTDAAMALCSMQIDAICQLADNLCDGGFSSIAQAAAHAQIPLAGFASHNAEKGAFLVYARDYEDTGRETGLLAARIIRGENPAHIPFKTINTSKIIINLKTAHMLGIQIPATLMQKAIKILE